MQNHWDSATIIATLISILCLAVSGLFCIGGPDSYGFATTNPFLLFFLNGVLDPKLNYIRVLDRLEHVWWFTLLHSKGRYFCVCAKGYRHCKFGQCSSEGKGCLMVMQSAKSEKYDILKQIIYKHIWVCVCLLLGG